MEFLLMAVVALSYAIGFVLAYVVLAHMGSLGFSRESWLEIARWSLAMTAVHALVALGYGWIAGGATGEAAAMRRMGTGVLAAEMLVLGGWSKVAFWDEFEGRDHGVFCLVVAVCRWGGPVAILLVVVSALKQLG